MVNTHMHSQMMYRDNLRLKAEKLQDTRLLTKQRKHIQDLENRLQVQTDKSTELQGELRDHQSISAANCGQIEELQSKVSLLETVEFVSGERAKQLADEAQPRLTQVLELTEQRSHQDSELSRALRVMASLKRTVVCQQEQLRCRF